MLEGESPAGARDVAIAELEAALIGDPGVAEAVVMPSRGERMLAYVVPVGPFSEDRLRARLERRLPAARLLDGCLPLSSLPLTKAGKVDRAALRRYRTPGSGGGVKRPAVLDGGPPPVLSIATLDQALRRAAEAVPQREVVYLDRSGGETRQTYAELFGHAGRILAGVNSAGVAPGSPVIFQLDRNEDLVPSLWACVLGGFVAVPMALPSSYRTGHAGLDKLEAAWQMLGRPLVLAGQDNEAEMRQLAASGVWRGLHVETLPALEGSGGQFTLHNCQQDDPAILLLTSGSTGRPKAVQLTHRNLLGRCAGTAAMNGFRDSDVSLNWMPLHHVGGSVMVNVRDVYLGCTQIHVPTQAVLEAPLRWLEWIDHYRATVTWAPNFAFALVNDRAGDIARRRWDLSCMRFIIDGGEPVVGAVAARFLELLRPQGLRPDAIHPVWGMTETSSAVTYSQSFRADGPARGLVVDVGSPIPGVSVRIVDEQDQLVSEGAVGRVQVRGVPVTRGYHQAPELNQSVFTADGWFDTGDLGQVGESRLTITGRAKEEIIVNGVNFSAREIEVAVEGLEFVEPSYTAACAVRAGQDATDELAASSTRGATSTCPARRRRSGRGWRRRWGSARRT